MELDQRPFHMSTLNKKWHFDSDRSQMVTWWNGQSAELVDKTTKKAQSHFMTLQSCCRRREGLTPTPGSADTTGRTEVRSYSTFHSLIVFSFCLSCVDLNWSVILNVETSNVLVWRGHQQCQVWVLSGCQPRLLQGPPFLWGLLSG